MWTELAVAQEVGREAEQGATAETEGGDNPLGNLLQKISALFARSLATGIMTLISGQMNARKEMEQVSEVVSASSVERKAI